MWLAAKRLSERDRLLIVGTNRSVNGTILAKPHSPASLNEPSSRSNNNNNENNNNSTDNNNNNNSRLHHHHHYHYRQQYHHHRPPAILQKIPMVLFYVLTTLFIFLTKISKSEIIDFKFLIKVSVSVKFYSQQTVTKLHLTYSLSVSLNSKTNEINTLVINDIRIRVSL